VVADFRDAVTEGDLGWDEFSGDSGVLNPTGRIYGRRALVRPGTRSAGLRLSWDFGAGSGKDAFTGLSFSLFGLTATTTTFDGRRAEQLRFPEHSLDLDRLDGALVEPGGRRHADAVCASLAYRGSRPLGLRVELVDAVGGRRFSRISLPGSLGPRTVCWSFRTLGARPAGARPFDWHRAKAVRLVVERAANAARSSFELRRVWLVPNRPALEPRDDGELLDLVERRACGYFVDWSSRKSASYGLAQDRSTFADLLSVGGTGFALAAYAVCAERGWLPRSEAVRRTLGALRALAADGAFGPEPVGRIGYHGFYYHFLGIDGRRKLNLDDPATPRNELRNTVEISSIDTGLLLMGVLVAQSYFGRPDASETEIRTLAQWIYDRVDWPFMLEPRSLQFYLAWKPNEQRDEPPVYGVPDAAGTGAFTGTRADPGTLDFSTDEASILALLAVGSTTHPLPPFVFCTPSHKPDATGLVRTYPGSLFTFELLRAFLDTSPTVLRVQCPSEQPVDWQANERRAVQAAIAHAERNPGGFRTYGPDAWGISATEGPDDAYRAYGVPALAWASHPEEDGTVTYYAMAAAASLDGDLRDRLIRAVRRAWRRGDWHLRFGLPDAFNDEIEQVQPAAGAPLLRRRGPWVQHSLFAIDEGPMLLALENARSGLVWRLVRENGNVARALSRLGRPIDDPRPARIELEAEAGTGAGQIMSRSAASGGRTVWLHAGEARLLSFDVAAAGAYSMKVRYSNDNFGPVEHVDIGVDGVATGGFDAMDTGDFGSGWNVFDEVDLGSITLAPGRHELRVAVSGGDGYGIELDRITLDRLSRAGFVRGSRRLAHNRLHPPGAPLLHRAGWRLLGAANLAGLG
jgi:hypothetical protein